MNDNSLTSRLVNVKNHIHDEFTYDPPRLQDAASGRHLLAQMAADLLVEESPTIYRIAQAGHWIKPGLALAVRHASLITETEDF